MGSPWTEGDKIKAITIAQETSVREAARATGIPSGTIGRWLAQRNNGGVSQRNNTDEAKQPTKKLKELQAAAVEKAVEEAGTYIADRLKGMADNLYSLAEKAVGKVDIAISDPNELEKGQRGETHDRDGAAWLRALVGVLSQSIDKAQLLSGKPTARPEVVDKHEYQITQEIIAKQPELIDAIFAPDQQRSMENRGSQSSPIGLGQLHRPDIS